MYAPYPIFGLHNLENLSYFNIFFMHLGICAINSLACAVQWLMSWQYRQLSINNMIYYFALLCTICIFFLFFCTKWFFLCCSVIYGHDTVWWLVNACSGKFEEFMLPSFDHIAPEALELKRIPKHAFLIVGHNGMGGFGIWYVTFLSTSHSMFRPFLYFNYSHLVLCSIKYLVRDVWNFNMELYKFCAWNLK